MKLEYLPDGSGDCPIIRLYDFDPNQARELRRLVACLADGSKDSVSVHELDFVRSVDKCELVLSVGAEDRGVAKINGNRFSCVLTRLSWDNVNELFGPFCGLESSNGYQWLDETGKIPLLFSPNGQW